MSQINVDNIRNRLGGAIGAPSGIVVTGVSTFSGDVSIGGTLTYEDVTNIDSVGVITARSGLVIGGDANNGVAEGFKLDANGLMQVSRGDGVSALFAGYTQGSSTQTSRINNNGNAYFLGNVGIGTNSPARSPLHIHKSGSDVYLHLTNSTTGGGSGDGFTIHQSGVETLLNNRETGNMRLYTSGTERLRILSDGAVIVGDGTNWAKYVSDANFQITDDTNAKLVISNPGNATYSLAVGTSSDLIIRDESQAADRVNIDYSTGNVTINDGDLIMGTSGHGIDFSATSGSGTSELFDDYEEGTWTPSIGGNATYNSQSGTYVKVGRMVYATGIVNINNKGTGSSIGAISGLPFASGVASQNTSNLTWSGVNVNFAYGVFYVGNGSSTLNFSYTTGAQSGTTNNPDIWQNGAAMTFSLVYYSS